MKAILTKRLPHTLTKPSRIKAYDLDGNSVVLSTHAVISDRFSEEQMHREAARRLATKMNWWRRPGSGAHYDLAGGATKEGYAWVFV